MDDDVRVMVVLLALSLAIMVPWALYMMYRADRGRAFAKRWAQANGWSLTSARKQWYGGPFRLPRLYWFSPPIEVYHVIVQDSKGQSRSGYIRCACGLRGPVGLQPSEVRWETEWGPP